MDPASAFETDVVGHMCLTCCILHRSLVSNLSELLLAHGEAQDRSWCVHSYVCSLSRWCLHGGGMESARNNVAKLGGV